ncbi:MAG: ankyrin repeat domain-containing protein [Sphingomonadales bacterium]|nr:ankyrin repeat domain-containing protein [Sphingomonadales bacterium]
MSRFVIPALVGAAIAVPVSTIAPPTAQAQYSNTYNFFQGIRDRDFAAVEAAVDAPGSTVINVREGESGDAAIHIVTRRRDTSYLLYLLRARANPNLANRDGNTAMHIAAQIGYEDGIHWLNVVEANVDIRNNRGETPLILAVQQRNEAVIRRLIEAGADPDVPDNVVGMSARDYAERDSRGARLLALLDQAQPQDRSAEQVGPSPN